MLKKKPPFIYAAVSILCFVIFMIYDQFSHGVRSPFMTFLFLWPLLLGFLPYILLTKIPGTVYPGRITMNIYNSGVAALTVSSLLHGIFDIAGNSSVYQSYLMVFGSVFLAAGIILYIFSALLLKRIRA